MARGRIAGPFAPVYPDEVKLLRKKVSSLAGRWIYLTLKTLYHVEEDWDRDVRWVWGLVRTTKAEIERRSGITSGGFHKAWEKLLESGLIKVEDGMMIITHFKLKGYDAISPLEMREWFSRTQALEKIHEGELDESEETPEKGRQKMKIDAKDDLGRPLRGEKCPLRGQKSPLRGQPSSILLGLKEKRSLSHMDIVSGFYRGIGQKRISKQKRERAVSISKKLEKDGFSLEDIAFAVDWTLDNAKDELYDFSILEHTIGQAIADRDKRAKNAQEEADREMAEAKQKADQEQKERDREIVEAYKANLSEEERDKLYDQAEEEIRKAGDYKESFIDSFIVGLKENEIVRKRMAQEGRADPEDDEKTPAADSTQDDNNEG